MKKTNELTVYGMSKGHNILLTKTSLLISSAGKIESVQEFKIKHSE